MLHGTAKALNKIKFGKFEIAYQRRHCPDNEGPDSPSIFLHHGLAQSSWHWWEADWCDAWTRRQVLAVDMLGHGSSDRPYSRESYAIEDRAAAVIAIADKYQVERFDFFGFSLGGRVGFELTAEYPDRINRLIVGGMHGLDPAVDRRNLERRIAVLRSNKWRLVERAVGAHRIDGTANAPHGLALSTEAVLDWRGATDRLPEVQTPTLIYCGSLDSLLPFARETADLMPNCQFVEIPGTNHAASFYTSEAAKNVVRTFLQQTD